MRPIATFMHANCGGEYRAGAYLTNLAFYVVDEAAKRPIGRMPIATLINVERRADWVQLTFEAEDGGPPFASIFKIKPRTAADILLNYLFKDYKRLVGKSLSPVPP